MLNVRIKQMCVLHFHSDHLLPVTVSLWIFKCRRLSAPTAGACSFSMKTRLNTFLWEVFRSGGSALALPLQLQQLLSGVLNCIPVEGEMTHLVTFVLLFYYSFIGQMFVGQVWTSLMSCGCLR